MAVIEAKKIEQLERVLRADGCKTMRNVAMSAYTTFKIGGPVDLMVFPETQELVEKVVRLCREAGVPWMVLGNGSNLLVADTGIRGVVLRLDGDFKAMAIQKETEISCGAGASLAALCGFAREHSLSGLEFAWGIPGSAGGAAFMNAGAYGGEMKDVLFSCTHLDREGRVETLKKEDLALSYRHSVYSENGAVILSLRLHLKRGEPERIDAEMADYLSRRRAKQPLEFPSAGSVFKRPEGHFAGALIEGCGLKGKRIGGAQVSEKHAGFIVNCGGATSEDVRRLIALIQETVLRETGVSLACEIRLVG